MREPVNDPADVGLGSEDETEAVAPRAKRRRLRRGDESESEAKAGSDRDDSSDSDAVEERHEVTRVLRRRGRGDTLEYLVEWKDLSSEWLPLRDLDGCRELVAAFDRYMAHRASPQVPYGRFVASDLQSIRLMADSPRDDCALHAVQMALELMGGHEETAAKIQERAKHFLAAMRETEYKRFGGLKYAQLVKFMREEMPKNLKAFDLQVFSKNWFQGAGVGPIAVASLSWRTKDALEPGVYLVYAYKSSHRGHCVAMKTDGETMVVRENGVNSGIMEHTWIRNIGFVRKVSLVSRGNE